jgi:hypothetical protein
MPWLSDAPVALLEDHRNVADFPRSIELGSAVKLTVGLAGAGCGVSTGGGGAGGGGGGGFLQPTASKTRQMLSKTSAI